jgi:hypothetical protein
MPLQESTAPTPSPARAESSNLQQTKGPPLLGDQVPNVITPMGQGPADIPQEVVTPSIETPISANHNVIPDTKMSTALVAPTFTTNQQTEADQTPQPRLAQSAMHHQPEGFPDVPGCESMEFVERMMENLRRASQRRSTS